MKKPPEAEPVVTDEFKSFVRRIAAVPKDEITSPFSKPKKAAKTKPTSRKPVTAKKKTQKRAKTKR